VRNFITVILFPIAPSVRDIDALDRNRVIELTRL